jgi:Na+-transporting methylmalonyl-CoA/oxaloacetate decarboxylase gamma subunit
LLRVYPIPLFFFREVEVMDNFTFGVTMMVCGMGGTILTLWVLSLIMRLLGKAFPEKKEGK